MVLAAAAAALTAACSAAVPITIPIGMAPPPPPRVSSTSFASAILAAHNAERARVGVAPLAWDPALAASASAWARQLPAIGTLQHSNRAARRGTGENLWMGTRGAYGAGQMIATWAGERALFRPGIFPNVSRTGRWSDVAHYTQMVWRSSQRIGCAVATSARTDFLVCHYAPAGNIDGRPVF